MGHVKSYYLSDGTTTINTNTVEYLLPTHWACYFINGDLTGYEDDEIAEIEAWETDHLGEWCVSVEIEDADITRTGDDQDHGQNLLCERCTYVFEYELVG